MQILIRIFDRILDIIFPRECFGCHTSGILLCDKCLAAFPPARESEFPFIRAMFDYRDPAIKRALWCFKYKNMRGLAPIFAKYLSAEILAELGDGTDAGAREKYLLVPIPLHPSRRRARGYNQSELLAEELMRLDNGVMFEYAPRVLARQKKTKPQAHKEKRSARRENLRDAFVCPDPLRIRGCAVVLIDDITTTGATLAEAKRALATGKPRTVLAFAIAH